MIFGLNQFYMVSCDKCKNGIGLLEVMNKNKTTNLLDFYNCPCGNSFTYIDGLINDFCSDHFASMYNFVSNIFFHGFCTITIGITHEIKLEREVPIINKIFLSPQSGLVYVEPTIINNHNTIKVISSQVTDNVEFWKDSIAKVGEEVEISWMLFGKTLELDVEPWRHLLILAKEQLIDKKYLLSYFSSATALESYLNSKFSAFLTDKGIKEQGIEIFLKESTMPDKLFKLSSSLLNIQASDLSISNAKLERIISTRNKIAHGKIVDINRESANTVFKNVLKSIFEIEYKNK